MDRSSSSGASAVVVGAALLGVLASLTALCMALLRSIFSGQGGSISSLVNGSLGGFLLAGCLVVTLAACLVITVSAGLGSRAVRPVHDPGGARSAREIAGPTTGTTGTRSPPRDEAWMRLVGECVDVVDELDIHMGGLDAPRREMAEHVMIRLEEVLARSGVEVISEEAVFDRNRHKPDAANGSVVPGAPIVETLSPGFAVGPRVLRRARVRVL